VTNKKEVLIFGDLPPDQEERIRARYQVARANPRKADQRDAFFAALPQAHGLIGSTYRVDEALLEKAPKLAVISSISVGVDNYDLAALKQRGIQLCHTPGVLTETTADTIFALIIAASRRLVEMANLVREGRWTQAVDAPLYGRNVNGKTLGILGLGRIGRALARRAALGFGMPVLYHDILPITAPELGGMAKPASLDEVLALSDIVAVVLPLTDLTRGLMGAAQFAKMKPGAVFVNGARGPIVREDALVAALDSGHLYAAGLDVFAVEPLPLDSPLRTHPKITALPHIGSATHETRHAMAQLATTGLLQALDGKRPDNLYPL
jgi:lactate dehydrogenase-like 2-hydroxyacid dehydrogenase